MRNRWIVFAALLATSACSGQKSAGVEDSQPEVEKQAPTADERLNGLLDQLRELQMETYPRWATYEGDRRYDDRLEDLTPEARDKYVEMYRRIADAIASIDGDELDPQDRDTQRMVQISAELLEARKQCSFELWSINGLDGPQVDYPMLPVFFTIRNEKDLGNLEKRYRATRVQIEQHIANIRKGLERGYVATKPNVNRAIAQVDSLLAQPIERDPMLKIKPADEEMTFDTAGLQAAVEEVVRPSLEDYRDVLKNEVAPQARKGVGVSEIPGGEECYEASMRRHIGPGYSPEELHQIGLEELTWAHDGMMKVAKEIGSDAKSAPAFIKEVVSNKKHFAKTEEEIVTKNEAAVARATDALPKMLVEVPETEVVVRPLEEHRAKDAPAAYYNGPPEDGSRPGIYYVNTYKPETRPLYNLEALAFHEANPGHHTQIAIAHELPEVHVWRKSGGQTAFTEGWALYAEVLADEFDLYSTPMMRFGMYNYQAWRAARLVVDTGIHSMGWSRQKAIDFLVTNTSLPENEVENEIDRYIAWPGQALAYMVGRREIQRLRNEARAALGDQFDIREFHGVVLGSGSVPLELLRAHVEDWIRIKSGTKP